MNWAWNKQIEVSSLVDITLTRAAQVGCEIHFEALGGRKLVMKHRQDCCESVDIESIVGDLSDLVGVPLLVAEEVSSDGVPPVDPGDAEYGSFTWTFYKFATIRGYVDIRWYGTSNGYYSESVDLYERPIEVDE